MKHARPDYERIQDPANLIPEDEPVFLLRGQDIIAAPTVEMWANMLSDHGGDPAMIALARKQAAAMRQWAADHKPDAPSPAKLPDMPR